jgi:hypothetical protein
VHQPHIRGAVDLQAKRRSLAKWLTLLATELDALDEHPAAGHVTMAAEILTRKTDEAGSA